MNERWASLGSAFATLIFLWTILRQYLPYKLDDMVAKHARKLGRRFYPYIEITIPEYAGERMRRSEAYAAIESYLAASCTQHATKLKAQFAKSAGSLLLAMDDHEEVALDFNGAKLWWYSTKSTPRQPSLSFYPVPDERRSYRLTFHTRHRDLVLGSYLAHVVAEGREAAARNRQRKLYTNNPASGGGHRYGGVWSHVVFEHPATFETLAMHPEKKADIMADLDAFRKGKEYYARIGKAWKRGYLLYGPPGTGKSTMISAIANYLEYDVYDVELTTVSTNTDLRKLLIETTGKSVVVIEDIDCSLDLTGKRKQKPKATEDHTEKDPNKGEEKEETTKVTLSGLLNFIDGLWSACGGERLFVFTTNHIEKLDPALIRRGRMDKHIEMSYCTFEAFLVLASNYMGINSHPLFERVRELMGECRITPADVAENLMPKSLDEDVEPRLESLIQALIKAKEEGEAKEEAMGEEKSLGIE